MKKGWDWKKRPTEMVPLESPVQCSQDDLAYLGWMFASAQPSWEESDALFLSDDLVQAGANGYTSLFYQLDPEGTSLIAHDLTIDVWFLAHFLAMRHPLEAHTLAALRLIPCDARSIAYLLLPYYRQQYQQKAGAEVWAFTKPESRISRGVIVHPSTKSTGMWQLTYFDCDGLDCDETKPAGHQTLLDLFARGYITPAPQVVDGLALHKW